MSNVHITICEHAVDLTQRRCALCDSVDQMTIKSLRERLTAAEKDANHQCRQRTAAMEKLWDTERERDALRSRADDSDRLYEDANKRAMAAEISLDCFRAERDAALAKLAEVEAGLAHRWECQQILERTVQSLREDNRRLRELVISSQRVVCSYACKCGSNGIIHCGLCEDMKRDALEADAKEAQP
jgi:hypothetical protein